MTGRQVKHKHVPGTLPRLSIHLSALTFDILQCTNINRVSIDLEARTRPQPSSVVPLAFLSAAKNLSVLHGTEAARVAARIRSHCDRLGGYSQYAARAASWIACFLRDRRSVDQEQAGRRRQGGGGDGRCTVRQQPPGTAEALTVLYSC